MCFSEPEQNYEIPVAYCYIDGIEALIFNAKNEYNSEVTNDVCIDYVIMTQKK